MFSWRLLDVGLALLLAAGLVSLALSAPAAEPTAVLRQAQDGLAVGQTLMSAPPILMLAATPIVREFAVVTEADAQWLPAISGNLVVWGDYRNGNWDIYGKNLATGREFAVVTNTVYQDYPAISGNLVVWMDNRNGNWDIYGKDLATGREFAVVTNTAWQEDAAISGNIVVWEDHRGGCCNIYGKDLATGWEFAVVTNTAGQYRPAVSGNIVVWQDSRNGSCGYPWPGNCDIYGKDLATGAEFPVVTRAAYQLDPAISGNLVVWQDGLNGYGNPDIYGKNLATGEEFPVVARTGHQVAPAISGNLVVWEDYRNYNYDIYGARLEWPPAPGACSLTGTVRGQSGGYYLEEAGRLLAFLYGASVNFPAYLGQRVTVGGPCKVWRESAGPRPVFLAQTIMLAGVQGGSGPPAKLSKGATRSW